MKFFANNLKYLRNKNNVEQIEIADYLGRKSTSSISEWENGKHIPNSGTLSDLAKFFHVRLEDLMDRDLSVESDYDEDVNWVAIPILGNVAAGRPIFAQQNYDDYRWRPPTELPSGDLFYIRANGDSMSPLILNNALVLCKKQAVAENGEIVVVLINGNEETTMKRYREINGTIMLESINPEYDPIIITEDNPIIILGKALETTNVL